MSPLSARPNQFLFSSLVLAPPGASVEPIKASFDFGAIGLPYESFDGKKIQVRYAVRVVVKRTLSDRVYERTVWVEEQSKETIADQEESSVTYQLGITDSIEIEFKMDRTKVDCHGTLKGSLTLKHVVPSIVHAELVLFRLEHIGQDWPQDRKKYPEGDEPIVRYQILEGPAQTGDVIPFRFHMNSCLDEHASKTKITPNYSIIYQMFMVLRDSEDRKLYKAQEITVE